MNPRTSEPSQTPTYFQDTRQNIGDISEGDALYLMQLQTMVVMNHLEDIPSRREYMRPEFARRKQQGDYYHIVRELECSDVEYFGK